MKDDLQILIECLAHAKDNGLKIRFCLWPKKTVVIKDTDQADLKLRPHPVTYSCPDGDEYSPYTEGDEWSLDLVEEGDTLVIWIDFDRSTSFGLTEGEVEQGILKALGTPDEEAPPEN